MKRTHVVRRGEYLDKIASRLNTPAQSIWESAENASLRALRKNPNMLAPGDVLAIPEPPARKPYKITAGDTHRFTARVATMRVAIRLNNDDGPLANEPFVVAGLPVELESTTDHTGLASFDVRVDCEEVLLVLPNRDRAHPVRIGDLDPIDAASGVDQRLRHLGYAESVAFDFDFGAGERGEERPNLLRTFQAEHDLAPTGVADADTLEALEREHRA